MDPSLQIDPMNLAQQFVNNWMQQNRELVLATFTPTAEMKKREEYLEVAVVLKETYVIIHILSVTPYDNMSLIDLNTLFAQVAVVLDGLSVGSQPPDIDEVVRLNDKVINFLELGGEEYTNYVFAATEPVAAKLNVPSSPELNDGGRLSPDEMVEMMEEQRAFISQPIPFTEEEQQQITSLLGDFVSGRMNEDDDDDSYNFISKAVNDSYQLCEISSWWKNHSMKLQSLANEMMLSKMDLE